MFIKPKFLSFFAVLSAFKGEQRRIIRWANYEPGDTLYNLIEPRFINILIFYLYILISIWKGLKYLHFILIK